MDKPPSNFFSLISHLRKYLSGIFFTAIFSVLFFSCSNTAPVVSNINAKVVYDYDNAKDKPVQKLSVCLEMKSEVRRIEQINIYHPDTGYRWIIKNPVIFENNSLQYAGYTNCQIAGALNDIPEGEYQVCYYDAQGRETFTNFNITKNEKEVSNLTKLKKQITDLKVYIAIYDEDSKVLFYSVPNEEFEVDKINQTFNSERIFKFNKKASYFRLFYETEDRVYIMPKVYKIPPKEETDK